MALKLRPTGLGSGIDKDRADYTVVTGEWKVGRIYETRGGPDNLRWFWSMTVNGPMTRADRVATLEEAKAQFQELGRLEGVGESGGDAVGSGNGPTKSENLRKLTRANSNFRWPTSPASAGLPLHALTTLSYRFEQSMVPAAPILSR